MIKLQLFLAVIFIAASSACAAEPDAMKICYIPFQYETAVPVTPSSIVQEKCETIDRSDSTAKQLQALVLKKPKIWNGQPDFNFLIVRLGIFYSNDPPLFVDRNGIVLVSNERYPLDATTLTNIEELLNAKFNYRTDHK